ncbi:Bromodomain-containing protein, partial [Baffinella frigidus]
LMEKLMDKPQCRLFLNPVDPVADGCADYLEVIRDPLDLGTIRARLEANSYSTMGEMADEVRLTFRNALTFNEDGSNLSKWATEAALVSARRHTPEPLHSAS